MKGVKFLALSFLIFASCAKKDNNNNNNSNNSGCSKPATPTASSNSPVNAGDAIKLTAPTVANAKYSWSGPSFKSTDQNPVIPNAVPLMSGKYSVKVTVGTCVSDSATTDVTVSSFSQPCTMPANTMSVITPTGSATLGLNPFCLDAGGGYEVTGSDSNGNYSLIAHFKTAPTKDGIYNITNLSDPGPFDVYMTAQDGVKNRNYHSTGGYAFVKVNGTSISITICQTNFDNPAYIGDHLTITANMGCQ